MNRVIIRGTALSIAIVLSGCAGVRGEPDPRAMRVNCDGRPGSTAIVTIDLTDPNNYSVSPKVCRVKGNRPITWTTTWDPPHNFEVRFTGETPDPAGEKSFSGKRPNGAPHAQDPYTAKINRGKPGAMAYEYVVIVNGVEVDPSIIIDM